MRPDLSSVDVFGLARPNPAAIDDPYRTERSVLLMDGRDTGVALKGRVLEGQFAVDADHWLLLLTDGSPYEETLRIHLLDAHLRLVEVCNVGQAFTPGLFRDAQVADRDKLIFHFDGSDDDWELKVHVSGRHFWNAGASLLELLRVPRRRHLQVRPATRRTEGDPA